MIVVREIELKYKSNESLNRDSAYIDSAQKVWEFLKEKIGDSLKEHFVVILLNNKNKIIGWEIVSVGTICESIVHPRETFRLAIHQSASSIIIAHNHPTGEKSPSQEDIKTTQRLSDAGKILGIPVIDHIIITVNGYTSLKELGYL